jgi:DNA-binding MarR family transcriptional regulator
MKPQDPFIKTLEEWTEAFMRRSMGNFMLYSKESGLSMSQIGALFHIHHKVNAGVSDIGEDLGISSAASSQMLERLVSQDLIQRTEDPRDRRFKQIVLTAKGERILQESMHARQGWLKDLAVTLSADEQAQIITALELMIYKVNQLDRTNSSKT